MIKIFQLQDTLSLTVRTINLQILKQPKGSMVYFKVGNETRKYKMTSIRDVKPTDVEVLDEQKVKINN